MRCLDGIIVSGHEFEQTPGVSEEQGSLAYHSPWGHKELDTTERLNNNMWEWGREHAAARGEQAGAKRTESADPVRML